jgi:RNA polymerase sigma-70 factor, ECF subfamily
MKTDAKLLAAWAGGDAVAGQVLFDRHYKAVSMFFRNKLTEDVEDLMQQTFIACIESIERLQQASSFRAFLLGVAHNVLLGYFRRKYRNRSQEPVDFAQLSVADLAPGPSTVHARHREQRLLLAALRLIPLEDQLVLELRYWEELNAAEIAEILGIPHPTARGRLRRARTRLQRALEEQAESSEVLESTTNGLERWAESLRQQGHDRERRPQSP